MLFAFSVFAVSMEKRSPATRLTMGRTDRWPEVESKVHVPGRWLFWTVGTLFLGIGIYGVACADQIAVAQGGFVRLFFGAFAFLGTVALVSALWEVARPTYVRHAAGGLLPNVSREPLALDRAAACHQVAYELVEVAEGWEYRPRQGLWSNERVRLWAVGLTGIATFTPFAAWGIASRVESRLVAALVASVAVLFVGAPLLWLLHRDWRAASRERLRLKIPDRGHVEFVAPASAPWSNLDLDWSSAGAGETLCLEISAESIAAVQLCSWYRRWPGEWSTDDYAVQGLLVLAMDAKEDYRRVPLLTTIDRSAAAVLMQRLAGVLEVPYLFHADKPGWDAELEHSQDRPHLKRNGVPH